MEEKQMTQAEKQIRRLEALRQRKDEDVQNIPQNPASSSVRTRADQIADKLTRMRNDASRPTGSKRRAKVEGKQRSSKLTFNQIGLLERILMEDKELRGSVITRIALNRLLGFDNTAEENDLENRLHEILRRFKNRA